MATRFYFRLTEAPTGGITPGFDGSWGNVTEAVRRRMHNQKATETITIGTQIGPWTATANSTALDRQYVSDPLATQSISGTVKGQLMVREYATSDNVDVIQLVLKVVQPNGSLRGTLLAFSSPTAAAEFVNNATHRNKRIVDGDTLSNVNALAGDRLVLEIGYKNTTAGTTPEASAKWGDNATDLPENETQTTNGAGWLELSATLVFETTLTATGHTDPESFGAARVDLVLLGTGYADADAFGAGSVIQDLTATGHTDADAFGSVAVFPDVTPTGYVDPDSFGVPVLEATISAGGYTDADAFGAGEVLQALTASGFVDADAFGANLVLEARLFVGGYVDPDSFGSPVTGIALIAAGYEDPDTFGAATVETGLAVSGYVDADTFGTIGVELFVAPAGYTDHPDTFGTHIIDAGAVFEVPELDDSADTFGVPVLEAFLSPAGYVDADAFGSLGVGLNFSVPAIEDPDSFGTTAIEGRLDPAGYVNAAAFGAARVDLSVAAAGYTDADTFGAATVASESTITASGFSQADVFGESILFGDGAVLDGMQLAVDGARQLQRPHRGERALGTALSGARMTAALLVSGAKIVHTGLSGARQQAHAFQGEVDTT